MPPRTVPFEEISCLAPSLRLDSLSFLADVQEYAEIDDVLFTESWTSYHEEVSHPCRSLEEVSTYIKNLLLCREEEVLFVHVYTLDNTDSVSRLAWLLSSFSKLNGSTVYKVTFKARELGIMERLARCA